MSKRIHKFPEDIIEIIRALVPCLIPPIDELDLTGIEDSVADGVLHMIREMIPYSRWGVLFVFRFFEWMPFLFGFGFSRFTRLSQEQRVRYAENWAEGSSVLKRTLFQVMRAPLMLVYFSDRRVWNYIGYDPEPHLAERIRMHDEIVTRGS